MANSTVEVFLSESCSRDNSSPEIDFQYTTYIIVEDRRLEFAHKGRKNTRLVETTPTPLSTTGGNATFERTIVSPQPVCLLAFAAEFPLQTIGGITTTVAGR